MVKINSLELENIKRIKAVKLEPSENGLTVIGGDNGQGKTSVLDAIAWTLGGEKYRPSKATREGSVIPPRLKVQLSNGLVVERKGKNGSLTVTDPAGHKSGQQLLNGFIEQLAIDLPKFMNSTSREKAQVLLQIIGVGDKLAELDHQEKELYSNRLVIGRMAEQKKAHAEEMTEFEGVPDEPISASELIQQQQEILMRNAENQRIRRNAAEISGKVQLMGNQIADLQKKLAEMEVEYDKALSDMEIANMAAKDLQDESTAELEISIKNVDAINRKVRSNIEKAKASNEAKELYGQYNKLTEEIDKVRKDRNELLKNADLPLPGLSVEDGELTYQGQKWDNMSGSEQLIVSTSIVRKLNPQCGFVLLDKLEQMDMRTLAAFGSWLQSTGLQAIATRVSTGDECTIIIEDGYVKPAEEPKLKTWKAGEF